MSEAASTTEPAPFSWKAFLTKKHYVPRFIVKTFWITLGTIIVFSILIVLVAYQFGPQLVLRYTIHEDALAYKSTGILPQSQLVPTSQTDVSVSPSGAPFSIYGIEFNLPCNEYTFPNRWDRNVFRCKSGLVGLISKNPLPPFSKAISASQDKNSQQLKATLGPELLSSEYALMNTALNTKLVDVSLLSGRDSALRMLSLEGCKNIYLLLANSAHPINTAEFRGFEFATVPPAQFSSKYYQIRLELFDQQNHQYEIELGPSEAPISQADVNEIVHSLHKSDN
ncbi:MAG: hypothetical protein P4L10_12410 [Acidobacteriaceae bacterium]|nr:hypothetical protein [Acidobacteriaceae bacterium]